MKLSMYLVYDSVAAYFNKPVTEMNDASAIRAFDQSIYDQPHATDYHLYKVAEFDDASGGVKSIVPVRIRTGFESVAAKKKSNPDMFTDIDENKSIVDQLREVSK